MWDADLAEFDPAGRGEDDGHGPIEASHLNRLLLIG
jgi:hypothetical protein